MILRRLFRVAGVSFVLSALSAVGCAGEPPRRPNIMHPVDEHRAVELLSRVFQEANLDVEHDRQLTTVGGKPLRVDVAAGGHKYGIAYLSRDEKAALGDAIPKRDADSDALLVVDAKQGDRVLVLDESDYLTDDLEGDAHSATTIAAETKIERDARDFVARAVRDHWQ